MATQKHVETTLPEVKQRLKHSDLLFVNSV